MGDFLAFMVLIVVLLFVSLGITLGPLTAEEVYPDFIYQAEDICQANGGLDYLELDAQFHDVYCNNGAVFRNAVNGGDNES